MISHWIDDADRYANFAVKFLVGNKNDLDKDDWEVLEEKAQKFWESKNFVGQYCVSAKTGEEIREMFEDIARQLVKQNITPSKPINDVFHPSTEESLDLRRNTDNSSDCFC